MIYVVHGVEEFWRGHFIGIISFTFPRAVKIVFVIHVLQNLWSHSKIMIEFSGIFSKHIGH